MSRLQQMTVHEDEPRSSFNFSVPYASSENSDDGCISIAPGVIAKLMGLDSLPTSDAYDSHLRFHNSSTTNSVKGASKFKSEHMIQCGNTRNQGDGYSSNSMELGLQKVQNMPIRNFQIDKLPPKSAKSAPLAQQKVLYPIRSPGLNAAKNAASTMKAADQIFGQKPCATTNVKLASFASPSVPLRIRYLKENEAAAPKASLLSKSSQSHNGKGSSMLVKGKPSERNRRELENSPVVKSSVATKRSGSDSLNNKEKSVSPAMQAKANFGKRESTDKCYASPERKIDFRLSHVDEKQHRQKNEKKRISAVGMPRVLPQNNQKQNCTANKETFKDKTSAFSQQNRKSQPTKGSHMPSKTDNKVVANSVIGTKERNLLASNADTELSPTKRRNLSTNKNFIDKDSHADGSRVDRVLVKTSERPIKCDLPVDGCSKWDAGGRNICTDIVSFTFSTPMRKSVPESNSFAQVDKNNKCSSFVPFHEQTNTNNLSLSSLRLNMTSGRFLSMLLELKIKELERRVDTCHSVFKKAGSASGSLSSFDTSLSTLNRENVKSSNNDCGASFVKCKDKPSIHYGDDYSSVNVKATHSFKELEELIAFSNDKHCNQYLSPISNFDISSSEESCDYYSSDNEETFSINGFMEHSLAEDNEINWISTKEAQDAHLEMELAPSAHVGRKMELTTAISECGSYERVLKYVKNVLAGTEIMLVEFASGQVSNVISPDHFDRLENNKTASERSLVREQELERKVLFDSVNECLESRCRQLSWGPFRCRTKWKTLFFMEESLAEELCMEISGWAAMESLMVDEVVENDMSTRSGKWVDFGFEAFEEGVEIENVILSVLIDELILDLP